MSDTKGEFHADIPDDAIAEALRSVEKRGAAGDPAVEEEIALDAGESDGGEEEVVVEPDVDPEVRKLRALLEDSASRAAQTLKRLEDTHERFVRVSADFDNFRKRAQREKEETVKLGNERLLKELLPVIDNLERAVDAGASDAEGLLTGVRMVLKQFQDTLGRFGVQSFSAVGEPFDPARHEALMQQESSEVAPGVVLSQMVKGYFLNERLVRPAAVVVAKAPAEPEAAQQAPEETGSEQSDEPSDNQ